MTQTLSPAALLLMAAAVLAIVFEAVGTGVGQRKRIPRHHQGVVVVVAGLAVIGLALFGHGPSPLVAVAIAACLGGFAVGEGDGLLGERAALALGLAAATVTVVGTDGSVDPIAAVAFAACAAVVFTGLAMHVDNDAAVEAAAKQVFIGAAAVILLGTGALVPGTVGVGSSLVGLALVVGVVPVQGPRLDLAHGASAGVAALGGLTLLALGPTLAHQLVGLRTDGPASIVVVAGLCGLPLVALNQVAIRRVFGVLVVMQGLLPITAVLVGGDAQTAAVVGVIGVVGLALASCTLPTLTLTSSSWEDVSGIGRLAPWRSGLVIFAAAQACGLAPTAGFSLRTTLARAADAEHFWLPVVIFLGAALAALPVVRLALFLFSKTPRHNKVPAARPAAVVAIVVVVAIAVVGGLTSTWSSS